MSRQQMDSGEINRDDPQLSSRAYEAGTPYASDSSVLYGQKLTAPMSSSSFSAGQRVALAIVSLVLWVVVFLIVIFSFISTPTTIFVTGPASTTSFDNPSWHIIYTLHIAGLLIFIVLVLIINLLFNRKH